MSHHDELPSIDPSALDEVTGGIFAAPAAASTALAAQQAQAQPAAAAKSACPCGCGMSNCFMRR